MKKQPQITEKTKQKFVEVFVSYIAKSRLRKFRFRKFRISQDITAAPFINTLLTFTNC